MPLTHSILLLQLVVILATARGLGLLLRYFGQPAVIGEMAAGIVLGPIVFGALAPGLQAQLFAKESLTALGSLSQLGLVLFMFIVGAELRAPDGVRAQIKAAGMVSVLSVLLPMGLGLAIAPLMYPQLAPAGVAFWPFALFIAVAMAVTAFPVLARILKDRNLTQTPIGRLALGSAAIADVLAWIMLALVIALIASKTGWPGFWRAIGGLFGIAIVVFVALRPLYARLLAGRAHDGQPGGMMLALLLIGAFACAAATEWLGLHAVFGAFLFGACLPRDERLLHTLVERIEHVAVIVLMPIFFALAGLNTTPDAFVGTGGIALLLILLAAVAGKVFGGAAGARIAGYGWRESFATGSLMNARGMMELIVIKVGLDAGVIGNAIFTMLMVMAILTTVMTTPMLSLFASRKSALLAKESVASRG
jgi:Kef-type K+ transport system membrane component KefB